MFKLNNDELRIIEELSNLNREDFPSIIEMLYYLAGSYVKLSKIVEDMKSVLGTDNYSEIEELVTIKNTVIHLSTKQRHHLWGFDCNTEEAVKRLIDKDMSLGKNSCALDDSVFLGDLEAVATK